jgi:uncharacterized protein YeeX (DUF496 family)
MKRKALLLTTLSIFIFIFIASTKAMYSSSVIDKIKPGNDDIPAGFVIGQIPGFAKNLLKTNPWNFDHDAIRKMTGRIYPGGEYSKVSGIHMTILAKQRNPYNDDIMCYIMLFRDKTSAAEEIGKLDEYVKNNSDRSILLEKENLAIYLCVDSVEDYPHIKTISENLQKKLDTL